MLRRWYWTDVLFLCPSRCGVILHLQMESLQARNTEKLLFYKAWSNRARPSLIPTWSLYLVFFHSCPQCPSLYLLPLQLDSFCFLIENRLQVWSILRGLSSLLWPPNFSPTHTHISKYIHTRNCKDLFLFLCVWLFRLHVYVPCVCSAYRGQKRAFDPLTRVLW